MPKDFALICGGDRETSKGSEAVTVLAFVYLHDPMAVARRNVLHGMKCHRLFAFLRTAGRWVGCFSAWNTPHGGSATLSATDAPG